MKQVTFTFNDDTNKTQIDFFVKMVQTLISHLDLTAVIVVDISEDESTKDILTFNKDGSLKILGQVKKLGE